MAKTPSGNALKGSLTMQTHGSDSLNHRQISLLIAIGNCGSISAAAKEIGISYKTAWEQIEAVNRLADKPLVERSAGGAKGGGTRLTHEGMALIESFVNLQTEHDQFLDLLADQYSSLQDLYQLKKLNGIKSRTLNKLKGKITAIAQQEMESEITVSLGDGIEVVATAMALTRSSAKVSIGDEVIARISSADIILSTNSQLKTSARNNLRGQVIVLRKGQVSTEVVLEIAEQKTLSCFITNISIEELGIKIGTNVAAIFKASSVGLMTC